MILQARRYLERHCSVMFFPEGTRSPDGRVGRFNDGAFHLAIKAGVPVMPVAVEGSRGCLPKKSWRFGKPTDIFVKVLPPVETAGLSIDEVTALRDRVRSMIISQISQWRATEPEAVDSLPPQP